MEITIFKEKQWTVKKEGARILLFYGKYRRVLCYTDRGENQKQLKLFYSVALNSLFYELENMTYHGRKFNESEIGKKIFESVKKYLFSFYEIATQN